MLSVGSPRTKVFDCDTISVVFLIWKSQRFIKALVRWSTFVTCWSTMAVHLVSSGQPWSALVSSGQPWSFTIRFTVNLRSCSISIAPELTKDWLERTESDQRLTKIDQRWPNQSWPNDQEVTKYWPKVDHRWPNINQRWTWTKRFDQRLTRVDRKLTRVNQVDQRLTRVDPKLTRVNQVDHKWLELTKDWLGLTKDWLEWSESSELTKYGPKVWPGWTESWPELTNEMCHLPKIDQGGPEVTKNWPKVDHRRLKFDQILTTGCEKWI